MTNEEIAALIERLNAQAKGSANEDIMKRWDNIRRLVDQTRSDLPRMAFEALLDEFAEDAKEAACALTYLQSRAEALAQENARLKEAMIDAQLEFDPNKETKWWGAYRALIGGGE